LETHQRFVLFGVLLLGIFPIVHAQQPQPGAPASDVSNIPKPITDTFDRINIHGPTNNNPEKANTNEKEHACLLSPLNLIESPTLAVEQLRIASKARKEYQQACSAIRSKKIALAERHLHKAVQAGCELFSRLGDTGPGARSAAEDGPSSQRLPAGHDCKLELCNGISLFSGRIWTYARLG
jgi:hypothetical protein